MNWKFFNIILENTKIFAILNGADFQPQFEGSGGPGYPWEPQNMGSCVTVGVAP